MMMGDPMATYLNSSMLATFLVGKLGIAVSLFALGLDSGLGLPF